MQTDKKTEDISKEHLKRPDTALGIVMNSLFDGIYIVDAARRILFWNRGAEQITGYSAGEVAGRQCSDNILNHIDEDGHLLCKSRCPLLRTLKTGEEIQAKIYPLHKSGRRFPVRTHIAPLRNAQGKIVAAIEVFRDISSEEDFRILQEKFNRIVHQYVSKSTWNEMRAQADSNRTGQARIRDLTIFYLDIVGFTALSEKMAPQNVVGFLNQVFGICDVITRENQGDIDKFIGDALLAVFFDANDAVIAARKILTDSLPDFNKTREEAGEPPIRVRIGINSGLVLQGDVGSADRKELTVIGDVVNTTQRIESICPPGTLLISESAYARLNPDVAARFTFHREVQVRGKQESVRVFAPSDIVPPPS